MNAPCRECKDRHSGCHSKCKLYLEWKAKHDKEKELINAGRANNWLINSYRVDGKKKYKTM